jgi:hypothetical protein
MADIRFNATCVNFSPSARELTFISKDANVIHIRFSDKAFEDLKAAIRVTEERKD